MTLPPASLPAGVEKEDMGEMAGRRRESVERERWSGLEEKHEEEGRKKEAAGCLKPTPNDWSSATKGDNTVTLERQVVR